MEYKELRKLWYGDKTLYMDTYRDRTESEMAVKLPFSIGENKAFFIQSSEVVSAMFQILKLDKEVSSLCTSLPETALEQYSKKCLIDEIVLSNNIEGVHSSRKEIGEVLTRLSGQAEKRGSRRRFTGLVNKYAKLTEGAGFSLKSCGDIRAIYDEIVGEEVVLEDAGNAPDGVLFRREQTVISNYAGKVLHKGLCPEKKIIEAMEDALTFLNDERIEPLYRIVLFHYFFEYIHPFYDGNGRTGRFILSWCISDALTPLLAYRISGTIKENTGKYYKAFDVCNDPHNLGDLTPFLITMLEIIRVSEAELQETLSRKLSSLEQYLSGIPKLLTTGSDTEKAFYQLLIQAALFSEGGISAHELMEKMNVSEGTLRNKYIAAAKEKNLISEEKNGNRKLYSMNLSAL